MMQLKVIRTPNIQPFADIDFSVACLHRMSNFSMQEGPVAVLGAFHDLPDFITYQIQTVFEKDKLLDRMTERTLPSPNHQMMRDQYVDFLRTNSTIPSTSIISQFYSLCRKEDVPLIIAALGKLGFTTQEVPEEEARGITTAPSLHN